ncbi:MAG TPA: TetR/AcrR family transcriptional regulator [Magnetospirillum sp.]|nr:TetR/AcrR family transcriptional regulator [Magnetospirillum sp.]
MLKPCTNRSSAKRSAILDAAQACFLEHGYANTSMDMVAATAGVSKATIYAHFQSKDELFGAIIQRRCDDQAAGLGALAVDNSLDARAALTEIARKLMALMLQDEVMGIYRTVVAESPRHPDLARAYSDAGPKRGKERLVEILNGLVKRGLLDMPDTWQAMDQFVGMLRGEVFHRALLGLPPSDLTDMDRTIEGAVDVILTAYAPK